MFYFSVVLFGVSLISAITCFPNGMSLDNSELAKLLQNFEDAREVNSRRTELTKLRDLEIDLLTERVLDKLASRNEIQNTNSENDEDSEINQVLRELRNKLGKNAEADITDRGYPTEDVDQDDDDETINRRARQGWFWCYRCDTDTKYAGTNNNKFKITTRTPFG